ncbi:flagellar biosynthesis anti-sigma factor FlgM [Methylomonas sp. MED-D]|uniref:Negative regulator of flagellin synthesis n=1 Tax=Methylomonas koyamae TaxID=702114 RepID=A0A177PI78_9GAMM|nr:MULTISPECIES: flagellar biosynthesis anti-sigma factor FlgM [Methylomonas]MDT4330229.1 flagellar biosynthesis anti-sigma factor FlgM [Methylomonas sp. MV1]OAI29109.1 hypothetical protein A1355_16990 [Methylomonas koyamae]OHX38265.1 flagellar biosynthesis anti-sigma factor FlgM [Methylomonas sp. LWB]WGS86629.1 flagellar biosynthesis anti-sigma factor FlgM [Methylomonas sp. UP202]
MAIESINGKAFSTVVPAKTAAKDLVEANKDQSASALDTDTVNITATAQGLAEAAATSASSPAVNEDRVAEIRAALQSGTYSFDPERIARKMMQFEDKLPDSS